MVMLGAHSLAGDQTSLSFKIRGCKYFGIRIVLTPADTYDVEFFKWGKQRGLKAVLKETREGIYFDMLHDVIESVTGLRTSL